MTEENHNKLKHSTKAERIRNGIKQGNKKAHISTYSAFKSLLGTYIPPKISVISGID